jgi:hypothetical protein
MLVPCKYRKILLTAVLWRCHGFEAYLLTTDIAKAMSGLVPSVAYTKDPTADWYERLLQRDIDGLITLAWRRFPLA